MSNLSNRTTAKIVGDFREAAAFNERFEVVEVVSDAEHQLLLDLHKKYGDKKGKLLKQFQKIADDPAVEKMGEIGPKSEKMFNEFKGQFSPEDADKLDTAIRSILHKLKEYQKAYNGTFKDKDEWLEYSSLLYQLIYNNYLPEVEHDVGFSKESAWMLRDKVTGAIAGGGNHVVYGNNPRGKQKGSPSAAGLYAFATDPYKMTHIGRHIYENSSRLMLKDLDRPELRQSLLENGLWRFAEVNNPIRMPRKSLSLDLVDGKIFSWDRIKFLHKIGYRAIRLAYISPPYLVGISYTDYTPAIKFLFLMALKRKVRVGAAGKLQLGETIAPGLVPLKQVLTHLKHMYRQTFDRDGTEDDIATKLLKQMKKAVKKDFTHLSTHVPELLEQQVNDHKNLLEPEVYGELEYGTQAWPGKKWFKKHNFRSKEFPFSKTTAPAPSPR